MARKKKKAEPVKILVRDTISLPNAKGAIQVHQKNTEIIDPDETQLRYCITHLIEQTKIIGG